MTSGDRSQLIESGLLADSIKRVLMDRIVRGEYQPGERIVESRVAKELGTSQSPVREALRDLAAIGIISMHSRRGSRVRMPTNKELADISLVRSEIDAMAATLAIPQVTEELLDELRATYKQMQEHLESGDLVAMTEADANFHRIIAAASGNHAILHVFDQLEPFARTFITLTMENVDLRRIVAQHEGILEALAEGNALSAANRARAHQLAVSDLFSDLCTSEP